MHYTIIKLAEILEPENRSKQAHDPELDKLWGEFEARNCYNISIELKSIPRYPDDEKSSKIYHWVCQIGAVGQQQKWGGRDTSREKSFKANNFYCNK